MLKGAGFQKEVRDSCRRVARSIWRERTSALQSARLTGPLILPGYFVDRFAYLIAQKGPVAGDAAIAAHQSAWPATNSQFAEMVSSKWVPARTLSGWVPSEADPPQVTQFGSWLRTEWSHYVRDLGLDQRFGELPNVDGVGWVELATESVFYPLRPAILGANYFDDLSEADRARAERQFGKRAAIDFFLFMLLVHETIHLCQAGEPLLNEIAQATLWLGFVKSRDLRCLQFNSDTGASCSMEYEMLKITMVLREIPKISHDTAISYSTLFGDQFYSIFCRWGMCFDSGLIRYRTYLDGVGRLARRIESDRIDLALQPFTSDSDFIEFIRNV